VCRCIAAGVCQPCAGAAPGTASRRPDVTAQGNPLMKRLLLPGLAAALCGAAAGSPALAWGPCSPPGCVLPYPLRRKLAPGYRTETRTEIRLVPRTVYRTVPETVTEVVEEQVLVPFWREEERSRDVMVIEHKEEKRPCKALIVGEEEEKRTRTLMVPAKQ